jgi:carbonic anhydrase
MAAVPITILATLVAAGSAQTPSGLANASAVSTYTYSQAGQHAWGGLCTGGRLQSPIAIDVSTALRPTLATAQQLLYTRLIAGPNQVQFIASDNAQIKNDGHTLRVVPLGGVGNFGSFNLPSGTFVAPEIKFRFPAEHKITNGLNDAAAMAGELQIMFENPTKDGFVGFSVLLNAVPSEKLMQQRHKDFFEALRFKPDAKDMAHLGNSLPSSAGSSIALNTRVDLAAAIMPDIRTNYFHYTGSLTAPPCTEGVPWYVVQKPVNVTWIMLQAAKDAILQAGKVQASGNNRMLQPTNGRAVILDALATDRFDHVLGSMAQTTRPPMQDRTHTNDTIPGTALPTTTTTSLQIAVGSSSSGSFVQGSLPNFFYQPASASSQSSGPHFTRLACLALVCAICCAILLLGGIAGALCSRGKKKRKGKPKQEELF